MGRAKTNGGVAAVAVKLDRVRHFRLDFNALAEAESQTGLNLLDPDVWGRMNITQVRAVVYAFVKWEDPELTLEQVGSWLHFGNAGSVLDSLVVATKAASDPKGTAAPSG